MIAREGMAQAELDALCSSAARSQEVADEEPSSPQSNQMLRHKRAGGRDRGTGAGIEAEEGSTSSFSPFSGSGEEAQDGDSSPQARQLIRSRRNREKQDQQFADAEAALHHQQPPEEEQEEEALDEFDHAYGQPPGSPFSKAMQQRHGQGLPTGLPSQEEFGGAPPGSPMSKAMAQRNPHSSPAQDDYGNMYAEPPGSPFSQAMRQQRQVPAAAWQSTSTASAPERRQGPGLSQAELDALMTSGSSGARPQAARGQANLPLPQRSIGSEVPVQPSFANHGNGLTQAQLNALSYGESSPRYQADDSLP